MSVYFYYLMYPIGGYQLSNVRSKPRNFRFSWFAIVFAVSLSMDCERLQQAILSATVVISVSGHFLLGLSLR